MRLAKLIAVYRKESKLTLRDFAKETGVQFCTLSRFESTGDMNSRNLGLLLCWLFEKEPKRKGKR